MALLEIATTNKGPVEEPSRFEAFIGPALEAGTKQMEQLVEAARADTIARVGSWQERSRSWERDADALVSRATLRERRSDVEQEAQLADEMLPQQLLVRPLLVVEGGDA